MKSQEFVKISTEYYTVAMSDELADLLNTYRETDPILTTFDDRKLILYIVNIAISEKTNISTKEINLSRKQNIKLKKTRKINEHFEEINEKYKKYGVNISSRQYFYRLIIGFIDS